MVSTPKPNGFADHYPVFNGYFIGNINPTFSDKPIFAQHVGNQLNQLPNTQGLQESGGCGAKQLRDGQGEEQTQQATPDIERLFFFWGGGFPVIEFLVYSF